MLKTTYNPDKLRFTSDTHWGHGNIIRYCNRPFDSVEAMDEAMITNWNKKTAKDCTTFFLGDFSFYRNKDKISWILSRLNGDKILIPGNHDEEYVLEADGWTDILDPYVVSRIDGEHVVMFHYPILSWDKGFHGAFHLHGHTHGSLPFDSTKRRLDVGIDTTLDFAPYTWKEIKAKLSAVSLPAKKNQ